MSALQLPKNDPQRPVPNAEELIMSASRDVFRLEIVNGVGIWEAMPTRRHHDVTKGIYNSIRPIVRTDDGCGCYAYQDVVIKFADGSFKRPDISIFCSEPVELDEAITALPWAVIEVISKGYEKKDLEIGVPFYLGQGIKDILVVNPYSEQVMHFRQDGMTEFASGATVQLECGCECDV